MFHILLSYIIIHKRDYIPFSVALQLVQNNTVGRDNEECRITAHTESAAHTVHCSSIKVVEVVPAQLLLVGCHLPHPLRIAA